MALDINTITVALDRVHSPATANADRLQAYHFLDSLTKHPQATLLAHHLSHSANGFPEIVRHFGLTLLEQICKINWSSFSDDQKRIYTESVCDLMMNVHSFSNLQLIEDLELIEVSFIGTGLNRRRKTLLTGKTRHRLHKARN